MEDLYNFLMFWSIYCKKNNKDWHRWATGGFGGPGPPPRDLKFGLTPPPWKIFEQVTPYRHLLGGLGGQ